MAQGENDADADCFG
ncbi:hypothetical protein [Parabacteroides johnsonii]